jgi:hypothetical protein
VSITHDKAIRLQCLIEDVTQAALTRFEAAQKHERTCAKLSVFIDSLEKDEEEKK